MNRNLQWRITLIFAVLLGCFYYIYPTARWAGLPPGSRKALELEWAARDAEMSGEGIASRLSYSLEKWLRGDPRRVLNLGLDLRGGMHIVLQVDTKEIPEGARRDARERALEIIRNRVDEFGVAEPAIFPEGRDRIVVQLPGISDPERAIALIGKTALLEFKLVAEDKLAERTLEKINEKKAILRYVEDERASYEGVAYTHWDVPEPKVKAVEEIIASPEAREAVPQGYEFLLGRTIPSPRTKDRVKGLYLVRKDAVIKGISLRDARMSRAGAFNQPVVTLDFDREGMRKLRIVSGEAERKFKDSRGPVVTRLGIVLDNVVYSAPMMKTKLDQGAFIEGRFSVEEANDLAIVLRAGALPAPVKIAENRIVGPSLGRDSIVAGVNASLIGLLVVVGFMAVYYLRGGIVADFALLFNGLLMVAALSMFRATLTLPGIAGIILSLGMAVDANVLIFERIREETALGRKIRAAVENGYSKAFVTIIDSNLTTLAAALILYWIGTGPVRGFAVTLSIGILTSMWTSLFVTHTVFDCLCLRDSFTRLRMLQMFRMTNIDFIGKLWYAMGLSAIVIALGFYSFFARGWRNNFGVDFSGGAIQQYGFARPVEMAAVRGALGGIGLEESMIQNVEGGREIIIKTAGDRSKEMLAVFAEKFPDNPARLLRSEIVGPVVGRALRQQAVLGLLLAFVAIIIYVWARFHSLQYGLAGVLALVHDVLVTVAACSLTNRPFDLGIVAALLTIVGFSINDTIVIFDRIRENLRVMKKASFREIVNLSINQTLSRTLITSLTALMTVVCIYLWGGAVIHDFAYALIVGMLSGIYSTVYIAAPILILWPGTRRAAAVPARGTGRR